MSKKMSMSIMKFDRLKNKSIIIKNLFANNIVASKVLWETIGLFFLILLLSITSPYFLTVSNILNVLRQISMVGIVSVGMTFVIITGGIDLSVGSVLALSGVFTAISINSGINLYLAIIIGVVAGSLCGFLSGILIASKINMPPFIATLAMMSTARGVSLVLTSGRPIYGLPKQFGFIAGGNMFGVPLPIIIMILMYIIGYLILTYIRQGIYYYSVGGNENASRLAGVNTKKIKLSAYVISGFTASVAGIIMTSRLISIEPMAGQGYELDAIAAVVIGGTTLSGGEGSLIGTFIGALIIGVLRNGLNLLNISAYWQQIAIGFVIASVVSIGAYKKE